MAAEKAAGGAVTTAAWAKAERLYPDRSVKISVIATLVGLSAIQLSKEAKRRGWQMRTAQAVGASTAASKKTAPKKAARKRALRKVPSSTATAKKRTAKTKTPSEPDEFVTAGDAPANGDARKNNKQAPKPMVLVQRVYNTIDGELNKLEQHKGASSQDRERASRALSQMVNSLEKAVEMQREITKANAKGSTSKDKEQLAHAEDLRRAIAERLERLHSAQDAGKRSATSE